MIDKVKERLSMQNFAKLIVDDGSTFLEVVKKVASSFFAKRNRIKISSVDSAVS